MGDDFTSGKRWHDMGGDLEKLRLLRGDASVDFSEHDHALWEKRVDALMVLLASKGLMTVDGLRRVLEDMGEAAFEELSYYERWVHSVTQNMIDGGHITVDELRARTEDVRARGDTYGDASEERK